MWSQIHVLSVQESFQAVRENSMLFTRPGSEHGWHTFTASVAYSISSMRLKRIQRSRGSSLRSYLIAANKTLTAEEKKRFRSMWLAGEHEAHERLAKFADERIGKYAANQNFPATVGTSSVSVHSAGGTLSTRTAIRVARDHNNTKKLDGGTREFRPGLVKLHGGTFTSTLWFTGHMSACTSHSNRVHKYRVGIQPGAFQSLVRRQD